MDIAMTFPTWVYSQQILCNKLGQGHQTSLQNYQSNIPAMSVRSKLFVTYYISDGFFWPLRHESFMKCVLASRFTPFSSGRYFL